MLHRFLALALIAGMALPSHAQVESRGADELAGVLAGIVHYTRWPEPATPLRVCVDARDELATAAGMHRLAEAFSALGPGQVTIEGRRFEAGAATLVDCQALYVGSPVLAATWQRLLKDLVGQPVLTIGYGEEFCSWGGQFCLERSVVEAASSPVATAAAAAELRIRANLDAISRSGLRVNPQLLRLTQRDPKGQR